MKELPIPFTAAMVLAIREGRKTQTRRLRMLCRPGDRLWVREAWRAAREFDHLPPSQIPEGSAVHYEADGTEDRAGWGRLRPPMFMCRWMSRLILPVTHVRGHKLATITDDEILAEGIEQSQPILPNPGPLRFHVRDHLGSSNFATAREAWVFLWDGINGEKAPWRSNPLVWAHSFEVAR